VRRGRNRRQPSHQVKDDGQLGVFHLQHVDERMAPLFARKLKEERLERENVKKKFS